MLTLSLVCSALLLVASPDAAAPDADAKVHAAIDRSLPYLRAGGESWRAEKKCVTCHRVGMNLWANNEARRHKIAIEEAPLADLSVWAFDFCATNKNKDEFTGGFLNTMSQMMLSQEGETKSEAVRKTCEHFIPILARVQREDGSWHEGNQIKIAGAEREADEVDTMWSLVALKSLEPELPSFSEEHRATLAKCQQRARDWLLSGQSGARTDWLMLKMLLARKYDADKGLAELRDKLLGGQNADGGWSFVKDRPSHAHVTGECLYALNVVGVERNHPAIVKVREFLLTGQQADGSWICNSRRSPERTYDITNYWGTAWATIGLSRTLP